MGKRISAQRLGRGGSVWEASTHKRIAPVKYLPMSSSSQTLQRGAVTDLLHEPGRGSPLALIRFKDGQSFYNIAAEGMYIGQVVESGPGASVGVGNILQLQEVPEATLIYNIEILPNDGGRIARASGSYATVIAHTGKDVVMKLPSGKTVQVNKNSRATVGVVSAGGRTEKPFVKAGAVHHLMRAKGHKYPTVTGVAKIAAVHPHGGGRHKHPGKPTTVARSTPPGRKVGLIAARQTGRAKRRMRTAA